MGVYQTTAEPVQEAAADQLHEAREDDQVRLECGAGGREGPVPLAAVGKVAENAGEGLDPGSARPVKSGYASPVGAHRSHPRAERVVGARVEQRLQVGSRARYQSEQRCGHLKPLSM